MKKKLNILCLIILLVLSYSFLESIYYLGAGLKAGLEIGMNPQIETHKYDNMEPIHIMPNIDTGIMKDSIYNEKSGTYIPVTYGGQIIVNIDTKSSIFSKITSGIITLANPIILVWAIILFFKILIAINQSKIFNWQNVRRLRKMGLLLVICFGLSLISTLIKVYALNKVLSFTHYTLSISDMLNTTLLILGLTALIVAEVFAIGLKLKEEQELTI